MGVIKKDIILLTKFLSFILFFYNRCKQILIFYTVLL